LLRVPEKWQISDRRDSINVRSWCGKPKEILANAYIGGDCNLALIPLATISRNSLFEVQTQVFTPTRILLKGLRSNIAIDITAKKPNGTSRSLGTARSDINGDLRLPPLTLSKSASFIEIELTWPKNVKYLFILRAIK
jgi:hypothetical protein